MDLETLLDRFPPVPDEAWEACLAQELKGADRDELVGRGPSGLEIRPYYRRGEGGPVAGLGSLLPARDPGRPANAWSFRTAIEVREPGEADRAAEIARRALARGVESVEFHLLAGPEGAAETTAGLRERLHGHDVPGYHFFPSGPWRSDDAHGAATVLVEEGPLPPFPEARRLVDAARRADAGADPVQELAFAWAAGHDALVGLMEGGAEAAGAARRIVHRTAAGPDHFLEIAKFRALRFGWDRILEAYLPDPAERPPAFVSAVAARWNQTRAGRHNNLLRSTTAGLAAVTGGCDALTLPPLDEAYRGESTASARRVTDNIQLLFRHEAHVDEVADPAAGSWYVESLTDQVGAKAWAIFLEIEKEGGFAAAEKEGKIEKRIAESRLRIEEKLRRGEVALVGVNRYPDASEALPPAPERAAGVWRAEQALKREGSAT